MRISLNNLGCIVVSFGALLMGGCANPLYSGGNAPVFSDINQKNRGTATAPAVINPTVAPVTANAPTQATPSIERPAGMAGTGNLAVNSAQTNPYQVGQAAGNQPVYGQPIAPQQPSYSQPSAAYPTYPATNTNVYGQPVAGQATPTGSAYPNYNPPVNTSRPSAVIAGQPQSTQPPASTAPATPADAVPPTAPPPVKSPTKPTIDNTQPARPSAPAPSATAALLKETELAVAAGNYDKAASALERAHRIDPRNPSILYDIAQIRYAQGKYSQAESFASKAASLSKSSELSKKIWTLLANSRRSLGNMSAAERAAQKAASF